MLTITLYLVHSPEDFRKHAQHPATYTR